MSLTKSNDLPSYSHDGSSSDSSDALEKTLVLAAAAADSRNNEAQYTAYISDEKDSSSRETQEVTQGETERLTGIKRKTIYTEELTSPKSVKTNDGQAISSSSGGYANVVATHYNTLEEKGLDERSKSRIFYMRNFHNWIKSMLINEYLTKIKDGKKHNSPVRVMDMCCGKGGDLLKWRKGSITHLICSDIASVSLDQCKTRYEDMKNRNSRDRQTGSNYTIEYIAGDCSRMRLREKYKDPSMKLDLVSCQFAFHYSFESLPQAECMLRNASECLQPGGFFIGTMPDAYEIVARAKKSDNGSFGNDVYQVTFECNVEKPPLFGAKYNFHLDGVVDCPEFLVHFPTFVKLAKKFGLRLAKKEKFSEFYERMKNEGKYLLTAMKSLETYPPFDNTTPVGSAPDDYVHAEKFIREQRDSYCKIGTLSKSEWEASSLYLTFVFEKVKNTWNADGTPCYDI